MADEVDCIRASLNGGSKLSSLKAPQPDLVNCAERSILAKQQQQQLAENSCKGIFGDTVVCNKSGTFKASPLEKFNMFVGEGGKLRKRSEPIKSAMRPKFVKSASIARLLGNNYSTATHNTGNNNAKNCSAEETNANVATTEQEEQQRKTLHAKRPEKFQKCSKGQEQLEEEDWEADKEKEERDCNVKVVSDTERKVSFSSIDNCAPTAECAEEMSIRGSHLNLMSHNSDIRTLRALRSLTKGLGKLLRRRTDSVDISLPDPEFKVSYLGNVLTGWAKGDGCFEKPLATLWRNYTQVQKPDVLMRIKVCPSGLKATTKQHGLTEYWSHRITHCASPKNYPRVFCWIYRHEGRKMKHELRCHAVLCSKEVTAKDICSQLQGNLFRALKEFKRDKISRQNARLSLANCVYDNPSLPRRKLMLSVGGNNYRPPLERSKSAPKLMAIEEAEDDEELDQEEFIQPNKRYSQVGSVGRRCWLNRNSRSVVESLEQNEEEEEGDKKQPLVGHACDISNGQTLLGDEGHDIDELVQENSFKLTPCISRYEDEDKEESLDEASRLGGLCDREPEGLEGEIMSYFERKLNDHTKSGNCLPVDTDDIISQLIRSQPPPTRSLVVSSSSLTSPAASESDEPESLRYQLDDMDSDADSYQPRMSPSIESDDSTGCHGHHYEGKGIQLSLDLELQDKSYDHHGDSDSDVSDESGFIEYQDHQKYAISSDINKADNSILV